MNTQSIVPTLYSLIVSLVSGLPMLAHAQSQEMARVLSSTPVVTQVSQPRQVCGETHVITAAPKSGAGALMGAIAGGAIGNSIGGGSGRALATAAGIIGGAIFGDSIETAPAPLRQQMTSCTTQISYENRVTAYNVVYEYGGKQYSIQLPNDPGPYLPVNITPSILAAPPRAQHPHHDCSTYSHCTELCNTELCNTDLRNADLCHTDVCSTDIYATYVRCTHIPFTAVYYTGRIFPLWTSRPSPWTPSRSLALAIKAGLVVAAWSALRTRILGV